MLLRYSSKSVAILLMTMQTLAISKSEDIVGDDDSSNIVDELDRPLSFNQNFKTTAPQGPSTTALTDNVHNGDPVTTLLISPDQYGQVASSEVIHQPARPGVGPNRPLMGQQSRRNSNIFYTTGQQSSNARQSGRTCQYIFTVENADHCTHTTTEIAVNHVARTTLPMQQSKNILDEYSERLRKLERTVYGETAGQQSENIQRDSSMITEVVAHNMEMPGQTTSPGESTQTKPISLVEIAQQMIKQLATLEKGIVRSEKEREDLRKQNKNLIFTLRRSSAARKNLASSKSELEKNLLKEKDKYMQLCNSNRSLSLQNEALRSHKAKLETVQESFRKRIHVLETEKEQLSRTATHWQRKHSELEIANDVLKMRVHNFSGTLENCNKLTAKGELLQQQIELEQGKNKILVVNNSQLMKQLENATSRIKVLQEEKARDTIFSSGGQDLPVYTSGVRRMNDQDYSYCGRITSISMPETVRGPQSYSNRIFEKYGVWMTDPLEAMGKGIVWSIDTTKERAKVLKQYESLQMYILNRPQQIIALTIPVESTGGVVYNGSFYYQRRNSRKLVRYDLRTRRVMRERPVHHAGFHGMFAYQWGGFTDIDLAVDEFGLWVIYSTRQNDGNIVVSRLNPVSLRSLMTMKTSIPKRTVANAFMACGILYTVDSYDAANASLNYEFDTFRKKLKRISIPFANQHRYNVMIDYNPQTREIYSWDNSHQVKYYVTLDKTMGKISQLTQRNGRIHRG
ncbi:uncharacterized protein LOC120344183 [Styela clava]